jgi:ribosomal protein S12 methylthiotransferase
MYANPAKVTDELIDTIAESASVVNYLDMPVQHISGPVLKKMGRRHGEGETRELVEKLHTRIPDLALRTSVMVGFPGETEEDFAKLLDFVKEGHFQRLGAFTYSNEEGTPASRLKSPVPPEVAAGRYEELMLAQQKVAFDFAKSLAGGEVQVLIEGENEKGGFEGRTYMDAPEVDCGAVVSSADVQPGRIYTMEVIDTRGYDLILGGSAGTGEDE